MKKILFIAAVFILSLLLFQYAKKNAIKIGFVAGLSGKYSSLGHDVYNGFSLAFDQINYNINGKNIEIITKDDRQNEVIALKSIKYFEKEDIKLIVGNTTSSMTDISLTYLKGKDDFFLISPTASSYKFSNIDDNFFRVQVAHSIKRFDPFSKYLVENGFEKLFFIFDNKNKSYVDSYLDDFQHSFLGQGGKAFDHIEKISNGYENIISNIKKSDTDAILIVANDIDSSNFIQYLRLKGIEKKVIITGWSKTKQFLENGGNSVEGVIMSTSFIDDSKEKNYLEFKNAYFKKYNHQPSIFAAQGYETAKIIIELLNHSEDITKFKNLILSKKRFNGLQSDLIFNRYGDVNRETFLIEIKNNRYQRIKY